MTALFFLPLLLRLDTAPLMPPGTSAEFQSTGYKVEQLIGDGKFDEANVLIKRMPKKSLTVFWDDGAVPEALKSSFVVARDAAIADWVKAIPGLDIKVAAKGDIKVTFQDSLPPPADSLRPAGAAFFTSDDVNDPRIEAVVSLKRDNPPVSVEPRHVQNEVGYAIGACLGLAKLPRPVGYMGRNDSIARLELRVNAREIGIVRQVFEFLDTLRTAIDKKIQLEPTKPQMFVNPTTLTAENVHQGDKMRFSLEVSNRGNATLNLKTFTECGCVGVAAPEEILPGQSGMVQVGVDTALVTGQFEKTFVLYSNDPDQAERVVTIRAFVKPNYRFLHKNGHAPIVVSEGGLKDEIVLAIDPDRPFKVTKVEVQGLKVVSDFQPWEGEMADPELGQGPTQRKGYKISFLASPTSHNGRIPLTIAVSTDSKEFPVLFDTLYVQWGIVAMPEQMYYGEIKRGTGVAYFIVSRPGKPFKVLSAKCDSQYVTTTVVPTKDGDYRVDVVLGSKVPFGRLDATITVKTDDPNQPEITVPVLAIIK